MNKKGSKHLTIQDRMYIESSLNVGMICSHIANYLDVDDRTISKEIQKRRNPKPNGRYGTYGKFDDEPCKTLNRFPFVCNACKRRGQCFKEIKYFYSGESVQKQYETILRDSRVGLDITSDEKAKFDAILVDGVIKKKQSINHIVNANNLRYSKSSVYRLINTGKTAVNSVNLPRAASFKPRKHKYVYKEDNKAIRQGRKYSNFLVYINKNLFANVVEMDTVESTSSGIHKCLLTLHFVSLHFMLIYVLDRKTKDNVSKVFIDLQKLLGVDAYKKLFSVVLTDRGTEFCDPVTIENDFNTNKKICNLFYCDSYASFQKGAIEENHTLIRKVIPKGILFDDLTQQKAYLLASHINSYYRESINDYPVNYFVDVFGKKTLELLNIQEVPPTNVTLKPTLIK